MSAPKTATDSDLEIRTERLRLRAPRFEDAPTIARLAADYAIASMTTRMPYPYGEADARAFIAHSRAQDRSLDNSFVIEHRDAGPIGALGFHRGGAAPLEMGYWIGRPHWRKGYATEAVLGALGWAGSDWRRKVVMSGHFIDNEPSAHVLIKAGFLYTGEVLRRPSLARGETTATRMMVWLA
jgi:RimJ/RimL family protein N-acetyltransferase